MPAIGFFCPDGHPIKFEDCFESCRMNKRCATLAYLRLVAHQREWRGVTPSMAGNGPRYEYLRKTKPYYIDPQEMAFAALGTGVHGKLSMYAYTDNILAEEPLSDEQTRGKPDCLEADSEDEYAIFYILTDYKTWGSYKVRKALGLVSKEVPLFDTNGKQVLYVRGAKKGQPKTEKKWSVSPEAVDMDDTILQVNRYRILFEASGFPVSRMQVQAIVRDGGTINAINNGITEKIYLIDIPMMQNRKVLIHYNALALEIDHAERTGWVRKCNAKESWDGVRCERFCDVYYYCEEMGE